MKSTILRMIEAAVGLAQRQSNEDLRLAREKQMILLSRLEAIRRRQLQPQTFNDLEYSLFSQFGDDGIIEFLSAHVSTEFQTFVEFGVENYEESNTRLLMQRDNWKGLVIDSSNENVESIKKQDYYWKHDLTALSRLVTRENINELILGSGLGGTIGILSIDIDGVDYWVWDAITCIRPLIVVCEYNSVFGFERAITVPYDKNFNRLEKHYSGIYAGASLAALGQLAKKRNMRFVGCNAAGNNAYFVHDGLDIQLETQSLRSGYRRAKFRESRNESGELTHKSGFEDIELISDLPVVDVSTGETTCLGTGLRIVNIEIPVYQPEITDDEKRNVMQCLESGWISSKGEFVEQFERQFAEYLRVENAVAVSNGTVALHLALLALGIGPGDEVIVPTLTYIASVNAITYTGARPVFVDCDPHTWQADPEDVCRVLSPQTRAIIAVHLYGQPCDMDELAEIASANNLLLIEDCAEAIGSRFKDQHVGTLGDIATFSFYGNKTITTGEGGMVVTNNPNLTDRVTHLKGQGLARFREYWHDVVGYNYRMTNICAAIGTAQLGRIKQTLERKAEIAERYHQRLGDVVEFQGTTANALHSHWMVSILIDRPTRRDRLRDHLREKGIETRPVFYPVHSMPMYSRYYRRMPNSDDIGSRGINLPSFPSLSNEQVEFVSEAVLKGTRAC